MPARRRTPAPATTFRGAPAARQGPARVHPWGLRRAAASRASGLARSSARDRGGLAPPQPDATVGRPAAFMQPPAGALTFPEPPTARPHRAPPRAADHPFASGVLRTPA